MSCIFWHDFRSTFQARIPAFLARISQYISTTHPSLFGTHFAVHFKHASSFSGTHFAVHFNHASQLFWHAFRSTFQARIPAFLARISQYISSTHPSFYGTHFDRLSVAHFAPSPPNLHNISNTNHFPLFKHASLLKTKFFFTIYYIII